MAIRRLPARSSVASQVKQEAPKRKGMGGLRAMHIRSATRFPRLLCNLPEALPRPDSSFQMDARSSNAFARMMRKTQNADDRRRRLPAQRVRGRPRRWTDADAVEFSGLHLADVGAADEGPYPAVSRDPVRSPRPWQVRRAARALFNGALRARRAGDPGRPQHREGSLVRTVDGRHGRAMARRQRSRAVR